MTPAEAGRIEIEEPDWRQKFEEHCLRWPKLPRYLQEDLAFEATLSEWRRWHWTPIIVEGSEKKLPSAAPPAIIALAQLGIMPPRSAWNEIPRDGELGSYQRDDHMWLSINQEQWRITGFEDRMMHLTRGFESKPETMTIDLNRARWAKYCDAAAELLSHLTGSQTSV